MRCSSRRACSSAGIWGFVLPVVALLALVFGAEAQPRVGQPAPDIAGEKWVNSAPLTIAGLQGRVVLVEFWTFG